MITAGREQAVQEKKIDLKKELESYQQYHQDLNEAIHRMVREGGLNTYVQ